MSIKIVIIKPSKFVYNTVRVISALKCKVLLQKAKNKCGCIQQKLLCIWTEKLDLVRIITTPTFLNKYLLISKKKKIQTVLLPLKLNVGTEQKETV